MTPGLTRKVFYRFLYESVYLYLTRLFDEKQVRAGRRKNDDQGNGDDRSRLLDALPSQFLEAAMELNPQLCAHEESIQEESNRAAIPGTHPAAGVESVFGVGTGSHPSFSSPEPDFQTQLSSHPHRAAEGENSRDIA